MADEAATEREVGRGRSQVAIAEAKLLVSRADVSLAELRRDGCDLEARRAGVVVRRWKAVGEGVLAFESLCEVVDPSELWAVIQVPVAKVGAVSVGMKVMFADSAGQQMEGRIDVVGLTVHPGSESVAVKVRIDNAKGLLRPGGRGQVTIGGK